MHGEAVQLAAGGTLTLIDENGTDRVILFFSTNLSRADRSPTANNREVRSLATFQERFGCWLVVWGNEIITDSQLLEYFFQMVNLSRRESRSLGTLGNFEIYTIFLNLKPGRVHVIREDLSDASNANERFVVIDDVITYFCVDSVILGFQNDKMSWPAVSFLEIVWPRDGKEWFKPENPILMFRMQNNRFLHNDNFVCSAQICNVLINAEYSITETSWTCQVGEVDVKIKQVLLET